MNNIDDLLNKIISTYKGDFESCKKYNFVREKLIENNILFSEFPPYLNYTSPQIRIFSNNKTYVFILSNFRVFPTEITSSRSELTGQFFSWMIYDKITKRMGKHYLRYYHLINIFTEK